MPTSSPDSHYQQRWEFLPMLDLSRLFGFSNLVGMGWYFILAFFVYYENNASPSNQIVYPVSAPTSMSSSAF